jgi:hypothetical protein
MLSASNLQTNYTVVSFVKYLENILQWIFQLENIYLGEWAIAAHGMYESSQV